MERCARAEGSVRTPRFVRRTFARASVPSPQLSHRCKAVLAATVSALPMSIAPLPTVSALPTTPHRASRRALRYAAILKGGAEGWGERRSAAHPDVKARVTTPNLPRAPFTRRRGARVSLPSPQLSHRCRRSPRAAAPPIPPSSAMLPDTVNLQSSRESGQCSTSGTDWSAGGSSGGWTYRWESGPNFAQQTQEKPVKRRSRTPPAREPCGWSSTAHSTVIGRLVELGLSAQPPKRVGAEREASEREQQPRLRLDPLSVESRQRQFFG